MVQTPSVGVRLLGPVDVTVDRAPRNLSGLRRKAVLAVLGLHAGEVVSSERIIDIVWGERPPASVSNALQNTISHLRGLLGDRSRIVAGGAGYALRLPDGAIDLSLAESLIRRRGTDVDPRRQVVRLRAALDLWNGVSLSDVSEVPWLAEQARRVEQLRADAAVSLVDARLALGEHARLVPGLHELAQANPFREDVHRQLILALYRCGRQAESLAAYRRLRLAMLDELGIEPSASLRDLEVAILRQDPRLDPSAPVTASAPAAGASSPAQLPQALRTFTARAAELAQLDAALDETGGTATGLVIISGTAGVGKTTLAVRWAGGVSSAFPDGQLYVNLRGFDPVGQAMEPSDVVCGFLRALGVPEREIPAALDDQAALYRTVLAGRRILVLLDNARDEEQVRPLLPGPTGGLVLVTSRNRLTGLTVGEGARTVALDLPSEAEARQILRQRLGAERMDAEPAAVDAIIARCARLPLALAVAAAQAATDPSFSLTDVARQVSDGTSPLEPFDRGDTATDVRAVFSWSFRTLSAPAARLFRLLGVCPTSPDLSLAGAASLAGLPPRQTRRLLDELIRMHLLTELFPDRFGCHDLLRAFATEQASRVDTAAERSAALQRLLDHYLHTAFAGTVLFQPPRDPFLLAPARPGVCVVDLPDTAAATAWFDSELTALLAAVRLTPPTSAWRPWQLAWTLIVHLERHSRFTDVAAVHHAALDAARRAGDTLGRGYAHLHLGRAGRHLNRMAESREHRERAIEIFRELGDPVGEARVQLEAALAAYDEGRSVDGIPFGEVALRLYRSAGFLSGEGHALSDLAWMHLVPGDLETARDLAEQGLALHRRTGDDKAQADTWDTLGHLFFRLGDTAQGVDCYREAISIYHRLGDRYNEADSLSALGTDLATAGDLDTADHARQQATVLLGELSQTHTDTRLIQLRWHRPR